MTQLTEEQQGQQRGLTLISALINFADWLGSEELLRPLPEQERAQLVLKFFDAHSRGQNYFMQAEQVMEVLGAPFQEEIDHAASDYKQIARDLALIVDVGTDDDPCTALSKLHKIQHDAATACVISASNA